MELKANRNNEAESSLGVECPKCGNNIAYRNFNSRCSRSNSGRRRRSTFLLVGMLDEFCEGGVELVRGRGIPWVSFRSFLLWWLAILVCFGLTSMKGAGGFICVVVEAVRTKGTVDRVTVAVTQMHNLMTGLTS